MFDAKFDFVPYLALREFPTKMASASTPCVGRERFYGPRSDRDVINCWVRLRRG